MPFFGATLIRWFPGPIPDGVKLYPGDEIHLRFQMIDYGTWYEEVNISLIREKLESDPRLELVDTIRQTGEPPKTPSYIPPPVPPDSSDVDTVDPPAQWITFVVHVREHPIGYTPEQAQEAGLNPFAAGLVVGIITAAGLATWLYTHNMQYSIYRRKAEQVLESVADDPQATAEEKIKAAEVLTDISKDKPSAVSQVAVSAKWIALAVIVYLIVSMTK